MKTLLIAFAQNKVFANLLMVTFLMAGILSATVMVREDMPDTPGQRCIEKPYVHPA